MAVAIGSGASTSPLDPEVLFGSPLEPTLDHISNCEYWQIDRTAWFRECVGNTVMGQ